MTAQGIESRQVSWWEVHRFLAEILSQIGDLPFAGTPAWCALDDRDPRKLGAVLAAGEFFALQLETQQQALAEASHEISAAADWSAIARRIQDHREFCNSHPWTARRVVQQ